MTPAELVDWTGVPLRRIEDDLGRQFSRKAIWPRASCTWTAARSSFPFYRTLGKRP